MSTSGIVATTTAASLRLIAEENARALQALAHLEAEPLARATELLESAPRIFVLGAGRSGLALRMTAMRLMHLGAIVHVVGDVTAPAIHAGDVLLVASGSGTTAGIVRAAETARAVDAVILSVTTASDSPLARLSDALITVPAAAKQGASESTVQYAGSLFEQTVMLLGDALFHSLWQRSGTGAAELWPRHANLE